MGGRKSDGRPLMPAKSSSKPKQSRFSKRKATANVLNAFALAEDQQPAGKRSVADRNVDAEGAGRSQKRRRDQDSENGDDDEEADGDDASGRRKKRSRNNEDDEFGGFSGSDSEGNEWHEGVDEDEDEDIDSDAAFGESDEERFEGFAFRGSTAKEDDSDDESLGSDAIDLAQALDQFSEDESEEGEGSGSSEEEEQSEASSIESDDDEDDDDPSKLDTLRGLIAGFGGGEENDKDADDSTSQPKTKLSLKDLGLLGVKDPQMKKSLKLLSKEEKAKKPGVSKKLDVPLPRRQQDQLLRSAAYEKASETLDRWTETVKHNRRAEHLVFPLAQNAQDAGLFNGDLAPLTQKKAGNELESTILAIMEESGLGPSAKPEKEERPEDENGEEQSLSRGEVMQMQRERRRAAELHSRELARAKRIKKIKSKTYRRIHRKERLREEEVEREEAIEAGEIDSEDEREAQHRRRAMERMGARHKESKWAKLGKKGGRAVWDDDFRAGLTDMARRKDELRRRVEGQTGGSDDEDSDDESDLDQEQSKQKLLQQLDNAEAYDDADEPKSALMKMAFMQRGEAARKRENDEMVQQLRKALDSDDGEDDDDGEAEVGRRQYGTAQTDTSAAVFKNPRKVKAKSRDETMELAEAGETSQPPTTRHSEPEVAAQGTAGAGAWSRVGKPAKKSKKAAVVAAKELDLSQAIPKTKFSQPRKQARGDDDTSDDEDALHLPMAVQDQELLKRAFAGADVVGEFEKEKQAAEESEDEKQIDQTLPGWGSWVGEGVSKREKKRHQGRVITKVDGVKREDRKDSHLKGVIISEKRVKKNDQYRAQQLPHPFETREQYERSLRLPIGPEWMTKETFQESTKPRVIVKQGIITPMSKPMF